MEKGEAASGQAASNKEEEAAKDAKETIEDDMVIIEMEKGATNESVPAKTAEESANVESPVVEEIPVDDVKEIRSGC